ncbi:MAG: hypothetical protein A3C30_00160 [Candidatus Levybacteria bacterium RIFCSPHIGHO2_02_FULL_40_18]|nr:MAG: hypothetical protein A2869_03855 [Candidatus Levybacteria bacterium RIFCSPHIGHO2_01_FULL_40_58]OGH27117.1 MAG: hypothetical protein A3C30_00160 [Candidatus Levybacteria bacterium RIFCSPHIGHO2_02_FULL_40_18]OGH30976.1 MAG: hypothetical protein A3E43_04575 [Candidatus Levybacteria bacterium RIFCSPHIGHO2_12_FULL_40_31]OGH40987.1 MAG: hypothetical protein A2894_01790 [Candidatus Levybacteria bacterium RIFCSPLOWO2_01_FULL_40_64]OGH48936.1 MAG: hypothetical protein A3I54_02765 [Candidatus Lev
MMDFNERVIPSISANFLFQEALARYIFAEKLIKKGSRVADIGCGTGYGTSVLAKKGEVVGIDNSREAISFAERHYQDTDFLVADATKLPFKNGEFDIACSFEVIEHLKNPKHFLSEAKRVLKKRGILVLSTPNKAISSIAGSPESPYHEKEYTYEEFKDLLKEFFPNVKILGQTKSKRARNAIIEFLNSQIARETLGSKDKFRLRKLIPKNIKEEIWKYLGDFYGRTSQNKLSFNDFPIGADNVSQSDYFIAICKN